MLPAPDLDEIVSGEEWLGRKYPTDFRAFLDTHNGYQPEEPITIPGERVLKRFLPVLSTAQQEQFQPEAERSEEILVVASLVDGRLFLGDDDEKFAYVPFATLAFGDLVCLDYTQPGPPAVAIWDHERSDEQAAVAERVADSFTGFMNQIGLSNLLD